MRLALTYVVWWIGLFWLWFGLQGEWNRIEWVAAACMATVAASLATLLASRGLLRFRVPWSAVRASARVPLQVVIDFGIITRALGRRLAGVQVRGRFVTRRFEATGRGTTRAGDVAWRTLAAELSPNAIVVDVDADEGVSLFHDVVVNRDSEEPA